MKRNFWKFIPCALAAVAALGAIVMVLWNWLAPAIFGLGALTYWQALGLMLLLRLLFGGFRHGHGHRHHGGHMREKWMKMSPDERAEFVRAHRAHHPFCRPEPKPEAETGK